MSVDQLEFFGSPAAVVSPSPTKPTRQQRAKDAGRRGMERAESRAIVADSDFPERARAFVLQYLAEHGETSGEVVTNAAERAGIKPPDARAFGSVYAHLSRNKRITCVGIVERFKGHGVPGARVWKLT